MQTLYVVLIIIAAWLVFRLVFWKKMNLGYRCPQCHAQFKLNGWQGYIGLNMVRRKYVQCPFCKNMVWAEIIRMD
jgi:hypothetical protein